MNVHVRGRHAFMLLFFYGSCFTNYDLYYEVIHGIYLLFMFCENKKFILVYLYFPHKHLWLV